MPKFAKRILKSLREGSARLPNQPKGGLRREEEKAKTGWENRFVSVFSQNLKITNLLHVKRFFFVNTCKNTLPRRSPNEQMGEFADSQMLEMEKSLLIVSKGQAQEPHPRHRPPRGGLG